MIEGSGTLVNEKGEETPLKASDFALVNSDEKHVPQKGRRSLQDDLRGPKEFE